MTNFVSTAVMVVALTLSASLCFADTAKFEKTCSEWVAPVDSSSSSRAIACQLFMEGWKNGIQGTMGANSAGEIGTYTFDSGVTGPQLVKVFKLYIAAHPEEENKPTGDTIYHAVTGSGLLTVVVEEKSGDQ
jgi:hypothetical protein